MLRVLIMLLLPGILHAQAIERIPYADLEVLLAERLDFEAMPRHLSPGLPLEGLQSFDGASIGERFLGQGIEQEDGFDRLTFAPIGPLTLVPGDEGQNLAVAHIFFLSNQIKGIAPPGFPAREAGGEGSIAVLFDQDQFAVGFRVAAEPEIEAGTEPGWMRVSFFRRDGTLVSSHIVELALGLGSYGFQRAGKVRDIAGLSIENHDPAGIAIDDVLYDVRQPTS
jgi:hypothetical protein